MIYFSTDHQISGRGFHLLVRQVECSGSSDLNALDEADRRISGAPVFPVSDINNFFHQYSHQTTYQQQQTAIIAARLTNQQCQHKNRFSSMNFFIESPNYPNYYLPGLTCMYTIQKYSSRICHLEFHVIEFDIEPSIHGSGCEDDYLLLDGVKYCNANRPNGGLLQIPFYEYEKRILFKSIAIHEFSKSISRSIRKGFAIQVRQVYCSQSLSRQHKPSIIINQLPEKSDSGTGVTDNREEGDSENSHFIFLPSLPSICEICLTEISGHVQSYDYPNYYPPNVNCTYRITPLPDNCMLQMRFDEFDFDYTPECSRDYLEINRVRYCGNQLKGVSSKS